MNEIAASLTALQIRMNAAMAAAADEVAHLLENYAKEHHGTTPREAGYIRRPGRAGKVWREGGIGWGDVTGATQTSITGSSEKLYNDVYRVVLSAGMSYDVFLELARNGKWAWLWPAVEANQDNIRAILARHLAL